MLTLTLLVMDNDDVDIDGRMEGCFLLEGEIAVMD